MSRRNSNLRPRVPICELWRCGIGKLGFIEFKILLTVMTSFVFHEPDASPNDILTSKKFVRELGYGLQGRESGTQACLSTVVQAYKNLIAGWSWDGRGKFDDEVVRTISNVSVSSDATALSKRFA